MVGQTCPSPPDSQFAESSMQAYQRDASIVAPGHGKQAVDENGLIMALNQLTVLGGVLQIDGKSFFMGFQVIDEVNLTNNDNANDNLAFTVAA